MFFIQGLLDFQTDSSEGSMVMVRPIWLSKDQASLVDYLLLTKLIYLNTVEPASRSFVMAVDRTVWLVLCSKLRAEHISIYRIFG